MNWTSTLVPMWESDCEHFWRAGAPFEVRDVRTGEQWQLVNAFAERYGLSASHDGSTVRLRPRAVAALPLVPGDSPQSRP